MARGAPLGRVSEYVTVFTDASLTGWGGVCGYDSIGGDWPASESRHINLLELHTVLLVLKHFILQVKGRHVLIRSDNMTTVAYINRQGGTRSLGLLRIAIDLWEWTNVNLLSLRAHHIAGRRNCAAEIMSRGGPRPDDWSLHPRLAEMLWSWFGKPEVDLFASRENYKCPLWFALSNSDSPPLGVDALSHAPWPRKKLYAFPPVRLILPILSRVREERATLILVAPMSPSARWLAELSALAIDGPRRLPSWRDALSQASSIRALPTIAGHQLGAWLLSGSV